MRTIDQLEAVSLSIVKESLNYEDDDDDELPEYCPGPEEWWADISIRFPGYGVYNANEGEGASDGLDSHDDFAPFFWSTHDHLLADEPELMDEYQDAPVEGCHPRRGQTHHGQDPVVLFKFPSSSLTHSMATGANTGISMICTCADPAFDPF
ncbi:hypothetical protein Hypma_002066 [Hypsizygus marmoreus]|uniref:Uncharacterized protein n=1 Tax=Hypsizygus marmoreus TaxID=39966 RepID=A0A369J762_HYPMA|nr:hypothetical protein Hypma_002066 [Hypsizygus marmoreus]